MNGYSTHSLARQHQEEVRAAARQHMVVRAAHAQQRAERAGRRAEKAALAARTARERLVVAWR